MDRMKDRYGFDAVIRCAGALSNPIIEARGKRNINTMYLNCHSFHSLRYGTIPLTELIQQAVACNVEAMALTDINTVTGIYDFIKLQRSQHQTTHGNRVSLQPSIALYRQPKCKWVG
jgi:hypothetical protein